MFESINFAHLELIHEILHHGDFVQGTRGRRSSTGNAFGSSRYDDSDDYDYTLISRCDERALAAM